jgi:sporulation protein YlmC with PRC-barrel domain
MRVVKEIVGKEVLNKNAQIIGKVHEVEVDESTFIITSLIVKKHGFTVTKDEIIVPFEAVEKIGDKILLNE